MIITVKFHKGHFIIFAQKMVNEGSIGKDKLSALIYATPQVNFRTLGSKRQITLQPLLA